MQNPCPDECVPLLTWLQSAPYSCALPPTISETFLLALQLLQVSNTLLEPMEPMHREKIRHHQFYKDTVERKITRSHREHNTVGVTGKIGKDCPILCLYLTIRKVVTLMFMWEYSVPLFIKQFKGWPPFFLSPKQPNNTVFTRSWDHGIEHRP